MAEPLRILHIVYEMSRGGMEACIMHFLRNADPAEFKVDFATHSAKRGDYDDEIESLGSRIHRNPPPSQPLGHRRAFQQVLRGHGPFNAVHSHDMVWGPLLKIAAREKVPVRITHSHNDVRHTHPQSLLERLYNLHGRRSSCRHATHGLAVSGIAADAYFGGDWKKDDRWQVLVSGRDFTGFDIQVDADAVRREFGFSDTNMVIGHVGSLTRQKNHPFLLKVFAARCREAPQSRLLLVGAGPERRALEALAQELGIAQHTVFAGLRRDIPKLLVGAMDLFLFPSLYEGLPGALVEAQAAGLPCVISNVIAPESEMIPELISRQPLHIGATAWADGISRILETHHRLPPAEALVRARTSIFDIHQNIRTLKSIYQNPPTQTDKSRR